MEDGEKKGRVAIRSFRELDVYERTREEAKRLFDVTARFPKDETNALLHGMINC